MESLPEDIEEYKKFKVVDLKQLLSSVGLPTNGKFSIALRSFKRSSINQCACFMSHPVTVIVRYRRINVFASKSFYVKYPLTGLVFKKTNMFTARLLIIGIMNYRQLS